MDWQPARLKPRISSRAAARDPKPTRKAAVRFWRITSSTKRNVELAIEAKQWGVRKAIGLAAMSPGDRIVFYVSQGRHSGYWGTGKVTSKLFTSQKAIWPDDTYPMRFSLAPDSPLRSSPITRDVLMSHLGKGRLEYLRQAAIIRLSADEFRAIAVLMRSTAAPTPRPGRTHLSAGNSSAEPRSTRS